MRKIRRDRSRVQNPAGTKIRRKAQAGTLGMSNPGGLFSEYYRNLARERHQQKQ